MGSRTSMVVAAAVACLGLAGSGAYAQQADAEWLAQCRSQHGGQSRYCEVRPVSWPAGGPIRVDARPNGGVQVTGWDQATVAGSARIQVQAGSEAEARELATRIVIDTAGGTLRADGPKGTDGRSWSVSFVLSAPRRSDLEINAVNGPVAISGISGRIQANTVNGPMSLQELGGDVRSRTVNGPLTIVLHGNAWQGAGLDAETQNGPVTIQVPDGYSANLDLGTVNGPLRLGIPVTPELAPGSHPKSVNTAIGAGGPPIRARTQNGPVAVEKR